MTSLDSATATLSLDDKESLKAAGNEAFKNQRFDEAIEAYTKAIAVDAENHVTAICAIAILPH
jgi:tetratricopeptide (TPR) repeat protein